MSNTSIEEILARIKKIDPNYKIGRNTEVKLKNDYAKMIGDRKKTDDENKDTYEESLEQILCRINKLEKCASLDTFGSSGYVTGIIKWDFVFFYGKKCNKEINYFLEILIFFII